MLAIHFEETQRLLHVFHWRDYRDVCSSYVALNGKSTEVLKAFTASFAQWRFETLCVVFEQLCKLRTFVQNDFSPEMFATSKDKPYHIKAIAQNNTSGGTKRGHNASLRWWTSKDDGVHSAL